MNETDRTDLLGRELVRSFEVVPFHSVLTIRDQVSVDDPIAFYELNSIQSPESEAR